MNLDYYYYVFTFFIDSGLDLNNVFEKTDPKYKNEIENYINFLKTRPNIKTFKEYKISKEAFEIFSKNIDIILKKSL